MSRLLMAPVRSVGQRLNSRTAHVTMGIRLQGRGTSRMFSVYDAIKLGLDRTDWATNERPTVTSASSEISQHIKLTPLPKFWAPLAFNKRITAAEEFVEKAKDALDNRSASAHAGLTKIDRITTEADVMKIANVILINPIEFALAQIKLPEPYRLRMKGDILPEGRVVYINAVRELRGSWSPAIKTLAVLSIKNYGIVSTHLGDIVPPVAATLQQSQALAPTSDFGEDAKALVKQCAACATKFQTRHIALCDLSAAMYFDFAQLPETLTSNKGEDGKKGSAGHLVLMHMHSDRSTFHYALLGFFKNAVDKWLQSL